MIKRIIFCTFRYNKGATGGPGGVLYLQKVTLGKEIYGIPCSYFFLRNIIRFNRVNMYLNKLIFRLIFTTKKDTYFFTHDIEMAAFLSDLKLPYSLIFHNQGPIILERTNMGAHLTVSERKYYKKVERKAFVNARTLHFPSNGAAEMYFASMYANCRREEVNLGAPFYNIIPVVNPIRPIGLDLKYEENNITLFSLGTLTAAKGQDLTVQLIREYAKVSPKPLRYLLVGKGPLKELLITELENIKNNIPTFSYQYYESLSHDAVMYLHKISDIYIMLHRISIFDFATLEAMSQHSAIILSKIGGNIDFNKNRNIVFAEDIAADYSALRYIDILSLKKLNYEVFCKYFSRDAFVRQYENFFKRLSDAGVNANKKNLLLIM